MFVLSMLALFGLEKGWATLYAVCTNMKLYEAKDCY